MPIYKCEKCLKIFQKPYQLMRHSNKKKPCNLSIINKDEVNDEISDETIDENDNITLCSDSINDNKLNDIVKLLNELKKDNEKIKKDNEKIKKDNEKLKIEVEILKTDIKNCKNSNQYITNNNNNCNYTYNININDYGHETIDYIDDKLINTGLTQDITLNEYIIRYINKKYINPDHPENYTITIPYAKKDIIKIFVNGKWVEERISVILPLFIAQNLEPVDDMIKLTKLNDPILYSKCLKKVEKDLYDLMLDNGKYKELSGRDKQIRKDVKEILYSGRDIVKTGHNKRLKKAYNEKETVNGYRPLGLEKNYISVN